MELKQLEYIVKIAEEKCNKGSRKNVYYTISIEPTYMVEKSLEASYSIVRELIGNLQR